MWESRMLPALSLVVLFALLAPSFQQDNNNQPVFINDLSQILVLEGISEDTPINTYIGQLSCSDREGDVIRYFRINTNSFRVDANTGNVYLSQQLDRESSSNVVNPDGNKANTATFQCVDYYPTNYFDPLYAGRERHEKTFSDLVITVKDANDNAPVFTVSLQGGFSFRIREDVPLFTQILGTITTTDVDLGTNANLHSLKIVCDSGAGLNPDPEPCRKFNLTTPRQVGEGVYTTNLVVIQPLDYEQRVEYRTRLEAVDGNGQGTYHTVVQGIRIEVIDSQDTPPVFTNQNYNFDVREGEAIGNFVNFALSAIDGDTGAQRPIKLEIISDRFNLLSVDSARKVQDAIGMSYQAELRVQYPIDREALPNGYNFLAMATELDELNRTTNATVTKQFSMNIVDLNDNYPLFDHRTYRVVINELQQYNFGFQIPDLDIRISDLDEQSNARFQMEIVSQSFPGTFAFTPNRNTSRVGNFYLVANNFQYLDYEEPRYRTHVVELRAVELLEQGQTRVGPNSTATVTITLTDINDNSPAFTKDLYTAAIIENASGGTSILTVSANDIDSGENGRVRYMLEAGANNNTFDIGPLSGVISLGRNARLDFEEQSDFTFLVIAYDNGTNRLSSAANVRISVTNYNDDAPAFTLPVYSTRVVEFQTTFESPVTVTAQDPVDRNAVITYRIVSGNVGNKFVLNSNTGVLTLREGVSYEETINKTGTIQLTIEASDNGQPPATSTAIITITVIDVNNYGPVFNPSVYTATLSETVAPGTYVLTVLATDQDAGSNGQISYRTGSGGRDSLLVNVDGRVYVSNFPNFDYDEFRNLSMQIFAIDGGSPQKSAIATLNVIVTDANNKPPVFRESLYTKVINESAPIGSVVLTVSATDPDTTNRIRYYIDYTSMTAIGKSGIRTESTFLYDFRKSFAVDAVTGVLTVNQQLDRDYMVEISFNVQAKDEATSVSGTQIGTTRVQITISGLPDRELVFYQPWTKDNPVYNIPILESSPVGTRIMTLIARDPVDQTNIGVYEEILEADPLNYFTITTLPDGTPGVVLLNQVLDYESGDLYHSTVVRATKTTNINGVFETRSVTATISITVQDFNDNQPKFTRNSYLFTITESMTESTLVGEVRATDADSSSFGPIDFVWGGGQNRDDFKLFQPPFDQGVVQILVNKPRLDYETTKSYTIDLLAIDNANNPNSIRLTSTTVVRITVQDENDNSPAFSDTSRSFSVPETAAIQTRLGQMIAVDRDSGLNGLIAYSLQEDPRSSAPAKALDLFRITESGVLLTKASLRGFSGVYNMFAVAMDRGSPTYSVSIPIVIKVQGAEDDDGTPQWLSGQNEVNLYEGKHNMTKLEVSFTAVARTVNASVIYSFNLVYRPEDRARFYINPTTGNIFANGDMDREQQEVYSLIIEATDTINTTMVGRRTLYVNLLDVDDNKASFGKSNYTSCPNNFPVPKTFYTRDKTPAGTIIGQAEACDPDGPGFNIINYDIFTENTLCKAENSGKFIVNKNGTIESKVILSYEDKGEYLVCVKINPQGRRKRAIDQSMMVDTNNIGYIIIKIEDVNDNRPKFNKPNDTAVVEAVPKENLVTQVTAVDPDSPLNSQITYNILDVMYYPPGKGQAYSMRDAFAINPDNGVITVGLLTYEDFARGRFVVTVGAYDEGKSSFNDFMNLTVVVHQASQILKVTLDKQPSVGVKLAPQLIAELNAVGNPQTQFFYKSASEHRSASGFKESQTDICFVVVENSLRPYETGEGLSVLDNIQFKSILIKAQYAQIGKGVCVQMQASENSVKWRNLWWVLVAIALFIFVCCVILIVTVFILYDRYKSFFDTERTYLVPG